MKDSQLPHQLLVNCWLFEFDDLIKFFFFFSQCCENVHRFRDLIPVQDIILNWAEVLAVTNSGVILLSLCGYVAELIKNCHLYLCLILSIGWSSQMWLDFSTWYNATKSWFRHPGWRNYLNPNYFVYLLFMYQRNTCNIMLYL